MFCGKRKSVLIKKSVYSCVSYLRRSLVGNFSPPLRQVHHSGRCWAGTKRDLIGIRSRLEDPPRPPLKKVKLWICIVSVLNQKILYYKVRISFWYVLRQLICKKTSARKTRKWGRDKSRSERKYYL